MEVHDHKERVLGNDIAVAIGGVLADAKNIIITVISAAVLAHAVALAADNVNIMTLQSSVAEKTVVEGEPVIMTLTVKNLVSTPVQVDLGHYYETNVVVSILTSHGPLSEKTTPRPGGFGPSGGATVQPLSEWRHDYVVSEKFPRLPPGKYRLRVLVTDGTPGGRLARASQPEDVEFSVLARDPVQLRSRCELFLSKLASARDFEEAALYATALADVSDPIVIPYLVDAIRHKPMVNTAALTGLVKFKDNPDAAAAIIALLSFTEANVDDRARAFLKTMAAQTSDPEIRRRIENAIGVPAQ